MSIGMPERGGLLWLTGESLQPDVREQLPGGRCLNGEIVLPVRTERLAGDDLGPFACGRILPVSSRYRDLELHCARIRRGIALSPSRTAIQVCCRHSRCLHTGACPGPACSHSISLLGRLYT